MYSAQKILYVLHLSTVHCTLYTMIIDGKAIAETIYRDLQSRIAALPVRPVLCDIVVGDDPVQDQFVRVKAKRAAEIGVEFRTVALPSSVAEEAVVQAVRDAVASGVHGIIVQLPLPQGVHPDTILAEIPPALDIDGLVPGSVFVPPTAQAIVQILDSLGVDLSPKRFVVVGQGRLVGAPVLRLLRERGYAVEGADIRTQDLGALVRTADVVVAAAGKPGLITPDMIAPGAVVIDAGTSESGGSVVGDVVPAVAAQASYLTPVPGGVGPVTVACLYANAVRAVQRMVDTVH